MSMSIPDIAAYDSVRQAARAFCESEVRPYLADFERVEAFPLDMARKMGEHGYLCATLPRGKGGADLDDWAFAVVCEEFGRYLSVRQIVTVQGMLCIALNGYGTDAQQARYLAPIARGELMVAYCLTEPGSGSDSRAMTTRAVRQGDGWVLNGQKTFITMANSADVFLIFAQSEVDGNPAGISAFLVDRDMGVQTTPLKGKLGQRSSDTGTVFLEDVRVPDANRLGDVGQGFRIAMVVLDSSRIDVAAASVGLSQTCLDLSTKYAQERTQFGRPLAGFQLIQAHLADMVLDTDASRMLTYRAIAAKRSGRSYTREIAVAKLFASEAAQRSAYRAIQIHGGNGYFEDYEVERLARDARILTIYEGTSEVQKLLIGRHLTGISAFT